MDDFARVWFGGGWCVVWPKNGAVTRPFCAELHGPDNECFALDREATMRLAVALSTAAAADMACTEL